MKSTTQILRSKSWHPLTMLGLTTGLLGIGYSGADLSVHAMSHSLDHPLEHSLQSQQAISLSPTIEPPPPMAQLTPVSELLDVYPTDWGYQAVRSLAERYGCLSGYPDGTFRGERPLSRDAFAAGLNACLEHLLDIANRDLAEQVSQADLEAIHRLQTEFDSELALLGDRLDTLETQVNDLENQQFSINTTLSGYTVFGIQGRTDNQADRNPRDGIQDTHDPATQTRANYLQQLYLTTSLSSRDYLLTGLWTSNYQFGDHPATDGEVAWGIPIDGIRVSDLSYRRLITDRLAMVVGTHGVDMIRTFRGPNRVESIANGPVSMLAQRNPILNMGIEGRGVGLDWQFAKRASLQAVYSAQPPGTELFNGNTTAAAQLLLTPTDTTDVSLYYAHNHSPDGFVTFLSGDSQLIVDDEDTPALGPLRTHAVGATFNWQISPDVTLGLWGGYTNSRSSGESGNVETTNYMAYLNFPDLFAEGNLGGLYVGQPPKIVSSDLPVGYNIPDDLDTGLGRSGGQPGTTLQIEAFYRFQLNDHLSITPGIIHVLEPGHTPDSDSVTIGVLRTSFGF